MIWFLYSKKKMGGKSLCFSLFKKRAIFRLFFRIFEGREADYLGWPKNKTHRLLSRSHSFLLKEPPSTTNERSLSDRVADKDQSASSSNASSPLWNKRESAFFYASSYRTPPNIWERERERDKQNYLIRLFLSLSSVVCTSSSTVVVHLSSSSRDNRKRADLKKERARASINVPSRPRRRQ